MELIQEEPENNNLKLSQKKNAFIFDKLKPAKTENQVKAQDTPKIKYKDEIFEANHIDMPTNEYTKIQNTFQEEKKKTQFVTQNIEAESNNAFENLAQTKNDSESNFSLEKARSIKGSNQLFTGIQNGTTSRLINSNYLSPRIQEEYIDNNLEDNIPQLSYYQSQPEILESLHPFTESQQIYENEKIVQSEFVESHQIYEKIPEQIIKYKIQNSDDIILNSHIKTKFFVEPQNKNCDDKKKNILINENELKTVEDQFKFLKFSKTKYLSEEEITNLVYNNDNDGNNLKDIEENNTFIQNPNAQNDNIYRISETNFVKNEENIIDSNFLGKDEIIKISKTQNIKEEINKINNEGDIQEPTQERKKDIPVKVIKIEDEENIHLCPDFISKFLKKLFGYIIAIAL